MSMTDPIADMFTRIRNAHAVDKPSVLIPASKLKVAVAKLFKDEGFIRSFNVQEKGDKSFISIQLKYYQGKPVINSLKRVSRPGLRVYTGKSDIPKVLGGLGVVIMSTPKGLLTGQQAQVNGVGGEIMGYLS